MLDKAAHSSSLVDFNFVLLIQFIEVKDTIGKQCTLPVSDVSKRNTRYETDVFDDHGRLAIMGFKDKLSTTLQRKGALKTLTNEWRHKLVEFCNEVTIALGIKIKDIHFSELEVNSIKTFV